MNEIYNKITSKKDLQFLLDIKNTLDIDSQREVFLRCKDLFIMIEPHGQEMIVKFNGSFFAKFSSFEDLLSSLVIDNKPFIEQLNEIEYE